MNKRIKKKIRNRCLCRTYKGFEEMKKFIDISTTQFQCFSAKHLLSVHGGLMDMYMDCCNNNDLEKFDKIIENLNKPLNSPKIFGEDDYFWLLDVIDNATCFNDPIEEVIGYIDRLLTDCGYDIIQVYQHILDKDEFVITSPSENAEVCLKAMGQSVPKTVYDFTKQFKDIARAAMSFHPELVDNKKA